MITPVRAVRCDDCTYAGRYLGDLAAEKGNEHAERLAHRARVLAATKSGEDTVFDYRPEGES